MKHRRLGRLSSTVLHDVQATSGGSEPGAILPVYIDWPVLFGGRASSSQRVGDKYAVSEALQAACTPGPEIPLAFPNQHVDTPASQAGLTGEPNAKGVVATKVCRWCGPYVAIVVLQKSEHLDGSQSWWQVNPAE